MAFGDLELKLFILFCCAVIAQDTVSYKISNRLIVVFFFVGLATVGINTPQALGMTLMAALFLPLYLLQIINAGDHKWAIALGFWLGPERSLWAIFFSLIIASTAGVYLLARKGRCVKWAQHLSLSLTLIQWPRFLEQTPIPFGACLALGAVLAAI